MRFYIQLNEQIKNAQKITKQIITNADTDYNKNGLEQIYNLLEAARQISAKTIKNKFTTN